MRRLDRVGLALLGVFVGIAAFAPVIAPYDPRARVAPPLQAPSRQHLLGTNDIGNDILSELLWGTRVSLSVAVAAGVVATVLGTVVGIVAGYRRGTTETVLMRGIDVVLVVPFIPLLIVATAYLGRGHTRLVLLIGALLWAEAARVIRSQVLAVREQLYVTAARSFGGRAAHIMRRHILPAVAPLAVLQFINVVKIAVLLEASLSFLGLGDPTVKSWGTMIHYATARGAFLTGGWQWWIAPAGLCVALLVVAFALVGLRLEERSDPRLGRSPTGPI